MKIKMKNFSKNDWDHMHDCILESTWKTTKVNASRQELKEIFDNLPEELKLEAYEFGMSDTLWRDKFIEWYKENFLNNLK